MKNQTKYWEIRYIKAIGGEGMFFVKGHNEHEALSNAKNLCHTGKDFKVIKEVEKCETVKFYDAKKSLI